MQRTSPPAKAAIGANFRQYVLLVNYSLAFALAGCGGGTVADKEQGPLDTPTAQTANADSPASADTNLATEGNPEAADEAIRQPATVAEAVAVLDLQTFPLLPGAQEPGGRTAASLSYAAPGDVKGAFEFQRRNLLERKWKQLQEAQVSDQSASAQFTRDGFHVSVSVFPAGEAGKVAVHLQNHSNVNLRKLPVPPGAKLRYAFPGIASFVTDRDVPETAAAVRTLLLEQGWQPYGTAGDSMHFKQNAVQLDARVLAPPAQPGKTAIDYNARQLSADLPAPADADSVQYADSIKQLNVDAPGTPDDLVAFYQAALAPAGWRATTEKAIQDRFEQFMIFRNAEKDMLTLTLRDLTEQRKTRVTLKHQSAAEVAELDRQIQAQAEARKKKEEEERNKPKPKVLVMLPADAREIEATAQHIDFKLAPGKAKAAVDEIAKQLQAAGWKAEPPVGDNVVGHLSLQKEGHSVSIDYVDPTLIPAEITISASGVEIERSAAKKE